MRVPAWFFLGLWFLFQLFEGDFALTHPDKTGGGGVAFFAHVGGFVFGVLVAVVLTRAGRITSGSAMTADAPQSTPSAPTTPRTFARWGSHCQHVQAVPRNQPTFVCEQCRRESRRADRNRLQATQQPCHHTACGGRRSKVPACAKYPAEVHEGEM